MSQRDPAAHAPDPEPEPSPAAPAASASPASPASPASSEAQARRPGEMRSAAPALCLFGVNLLLVVVLVSSSLWPALFHLTQPLQVVPSAASTTTATDVPGVQPPIAPSIQATTQATAPVHATATPHAQQPTPTTAPPAPTTAPPTPVATQVNGGG